MGYFARRRRRRRFIIAGILFFAAIVTFITPSIMKMANKAHMDSIVYNFEETAQEMREDGSYRDALENGEIDDEGYPIDEEGNRTDDKPVVYKYDIDRLYKDSLAYNTEVVAGQHLSEWQFTQPALNLGDYGIWNGVYAYVTIPALGLDVPIYLGATNYNMSIGVTHLGGTSLPIGGETSNCVIAGHNGYTGRTFFDYISELDVGDSVSVTNYFYTLEYEVIESKQILSTDVSGVYLAPHKDRLTLLTCADRGRERWQVTCERKNQNNS